MNRSVCESIRQYKEQFLSSSKHSCVYRRASIFSIIGGALSVTVIEYQSWILCFALY